MSVLTFNLGRTDTFHLTAKDAAGNRISLVGKSVLFGVRPDELADLTIGASIGSGITLTDAANGDFDLVLVPLAKVGLTAGRTYLWDVLVIDAAGVPTTPTNLSGDVIVSATVTPVTLRDTLPAPVSVAAIDGLTGGTATKLDGITADDLSAFNVGEFVDLFFAGSVSVRYRLRTVVGGDVEVIGTAGGFLILADNDPTRCWELVAVTKQGQPCAWNPTSGKWHRVWALGADGAATAGTDDSGFSLPA